MKGKRNKANVIHYDEKNRVEKKEFIPPSVGHKPALENEKEGVFLELIKEKDTACLQSDNNVSDFDLLKMFFPYNKSSTEKKVLPEFLYSEPDFYFPYKGRTIKIIVDDHIYDLYKTFVDDIRMKYSGVALPPMPIVDFCLTQVRKWFYEKLEIEYQAQLQHEKTSVQHQAQFQHEKISKTDTILNFLKEFDLLDDYRLASVIRLIADPNPYSVLEDFKEAKELLENRIKEIETLVNAD